MKRLLIPIIAITLTLLFFMQCNPPSSSSGGGSSSGGSDGKSSDDTEETSFKTTVDSVGDVGLDTSIAVDGSNVYISYYDITNQDLKFAKSTDGGNTWNPGNIKTVDSAGNVGLNTSIAVDGSNVYISYYANSNEDLKFAKSTDGGNTWDPGNIRTVASIGYVGWYTSIAVDGLNIYISYYDYTNGNLMFIKSTDGGDIWRASNRYVVDSIGDVGLFTSLVVDGSNVYISYYDGSNGNLKFAKSIDEGDNWDIGNIKIVDSLGNVGLFTSIIADGFNVYISYYDYSNSGLKFAKSTDRGGTWAPINIKTVDYTGSVGWYTSIAVDSSNVYISYYDLTNENLRFAKSIDEGNTWDIDNIKKVDSIGDVGKSTSIAVDGSNVYISYYDQTNGDLKFAKSIDNGNTW